MSSPKAAETRRRILAAEDNDANREILKGMVEYLGHEIVLVNNGREALAAFERDASFDVLLMDCQMPELDGYGTTVGIRELEARHGRARVPIIAVTAHAFSGEREKVLECGMDDYLTKPVHLATLRQKLLQWLPAAPPSAIASSDRARAASTAPSPTPGAEARAQPIDDTVIAELKKLASPRRPRFFADIVERYAGDTARYVDAISAAATSGDAAALRDAAHALKGSSRAVGARDVASLCAELEGLGESGTVLGASGTVAALPAALEHAIAALRRAALP